VVQFGIVWSLADTMNGLMAAPNLIALLGLSGVITAETVRFRKRMKEEKNGTATWNKS
jgi:AGCS family alanine or glycine:cation symporter